MVAHGGVRSQYPGLACLSPPLVDTDNNRVIVLGYTDNELKAYDPVVFTSPTTTLSLDHRALRGALGNGRLYIASGVDDSVEVYDAATLEHLETYETAGQTTDVWYDHLQHRVWAAVLGADEVVAFDADTGDVVVELPWDQPFLLNPNRR